MTFGDFIIRFEHKFLRNIYTTEQIESSDQINNLKFFLKFSIVTSKFVLVYLSF